MQRLRAAHGIHISTGAPTAPQTNDIVKIPPFTAKASVSIYVPIKCQALPSTNEIEGRAIGDGAVTALDTAAITVGACPNGKSAAQREVSSSGAGDDGRPSMRAKSTPVSSETSAFGQRVQAYFKEPENLPQYERRSPGNAISGSDQFSQTEGQHVRRFNTSVATFWDRYGQQLWKRTYAPFGNSNRLDPLFHQVFNLHVELQLLINNIDYDDTLVQFLCFPHPAWPVLSLNPPTPKKILAGDPGRSAIVMNYWVNPSVRFWPEAPPIPHLRKAGNEVWYRGLGDSVAYLAQRKIRTFMANQARKKGIVDAVSMIRRLATVSRNFIDAGRPWRNEPYPFVSVTFPDDLLSREWTNEVIAPRTTYSWNGQIANVVFWKDSPLLRAPMMDILDLDNSDSDSEEKDDDPNYSASEGDDGHNDED
ncbi:hypothetical protein H257_14658 [Aphanomyces astaci]|uniref:Uncharacterized protein n=1 Tax=Aphanomyces astaci TaxID=112090 RepID=W4FQ86_APHAT|nr:hypothetical protein H257_14658 [Aphanomyces astaci]ETV69635.1 hypothetical protein H257_14658 [Aphanomyces astaci]|eukprot:XP_009840851.1 hypothetical protein H257_14658 [Aphanomyces astaci]